MKKLIKITALCAICASGAFVPALAQNIPDQPSDTNASPPMEQPDQAPPPEMAPGQPAGGASPDQGVSADQPPVVFQGQNQSSEPDEVITPKASAGNQPAMTAPTSFMPPAQATGSNPDELRLNFQNVPLQEVLNYLSDAAGFVIILQTQVHGTVSVISDHPMTRDQAVDLLNSVLNQNGYAAIRGGTDNRTLTIVDKNDAKTRDIPVRIGNDPSAVLNNDEIVTQIIPIRYVDASQLVSDLSSFVSPQATVVANQAGNSIVITDTQENIRHLMEIIEAIDSSAAGENVIQVFNLKYANPSDVATELGNIFPSGSTGSGPQLPLAFGGRGGFGGGGGPGGFFARLAAANAANNSNGNRAQKQSQVTAVADARTQSVIVMASKDLMPEIAGMIEGLDIPSPRDQQVYTYHMDHGDVLEDEQILNTMFGGNNSRNNTSSQQQETSPLIQRNIQNATTVGNTSSTISSGIGQTGAGNSRGGGGGGNF